MFFAQVNESVADEQDFADYAFDLIAGKKTTKVFLTVCNLMIYGVAFKSKRNSFLTLLLKTVR